jgi:hypothetical protein
MNTWKVRRSQLNTHYENSTRARSIRRRDGINDAERYLKQLCDQSFLSLWSYSGVCRDQIFAKNSTEGREVCDLLVVFENHIIIFSDKNCAYSMEGDREVNWRRWFRQAIEQSAKQVWGAERWIKDHPKRLFLDLACRQPFPISLPDPATATFHRILVAHGISKPCIEAFGGSGSLMIAPRVVGSMHTQNGCQPFTIGQINPKKGYVHVFDDTTLDVVMQTLDTITDFVMYLTKKERFIQSEQLVWAAGEDDLLAYYLSDINNSGEHDFIVPNNANSIVVPEGLWAEFVRNPRRLAQLEENEVSYMWDMLIERFTEHILARTQYYSSHGNIKQSERSMRFLAREPRTRRRMLAHSLLDLLETRPFSKKKSRIMQPSRPGDPYYIFLLLPWPQGMSVTRYRELRYMLLEAYCIVTKLIYPDAQDIVGIATEADSIFSESRSEDAIYLDARDWTDEYQAEATRLQQECDILTNITGPFKSVEQEYPIVQVKPMAPMKGRERNLPCPCRSGKKYKKCCGR